MKLVSVIMPAYNAGQYIKEAIDSILNQTYTNLELLVSDDPSKDNTRKIIDLYDDSRLKIFHNEKRLGFINTLNFLFSKTTGDYITTMDADDYSELNRIELLVNELEKDITLGACGSNFKRIDQNGNLSFTSQFVLTHDEIFSKMPAEFDFVGSSLMITREVLDTIGGYNNFFDGMGAEDYYWFYLIAEKFKVKNIEPALYNYRLNNNSISGNWSDNPKKIHTQTILKYLINSRKLNKVDPLSNNNLNELNELLKKINLPYVMDPSLFYRQMATKYFYSGLYKRAIKLCIKAIWKNIFNKENYRNLFYFCKIIISKLIFEK